MDWGNLFKEFGLIGVLSIAIVGALFLLLKWVLEQFKDELKANRQERKEYLEVLNKIKEDIKEHSDRAKENQISTQREHNEMITCLGRINGYKS